MSEAISKDRSRASPALALPLASRKGRTVSAEALSSTFRLETDGKWFLPFTTNESPLSGTVCHTSLPQAKQEIESLQNSIRKQTFQEMQNWAS